MQVARSLETKFKARFSDNQFYLKWIHCLKCSFGHTKIFSQKKKELQSYYSLDLVYFSKNLSFLAKTKIDNK